MFIIIIFRISKFPFPYLWYSFYDDVKIYVTLYLMYGVSQNNSNNCNVNNM